MRLITFILIVVDDSQSDIIALIWDSDARGEFNNLGGCIIHVFVLCIINHF